MCRNHWRSWKTLFVYHMFDTSVLCNRWHSHKCCWKSWLLWYRCKPFHSNRAWSFSKRHIRRNIYLLLHHMFFHRHRTAKVNRTRHHRYLLLPIGSPNYLGTSNSQVWLKRFPQKTNLSLHYRLDTLHHQDIGAIQYTSMPGTRLRMEKRTIGQNRKS